MGIKSVLVSCALLASLPAHAGGLFQPIELTDPELAQLRGRYVLPDRIISFGVTMTSMWQNSAGQVIGAQVNLNVDGRSQPSLTVTAIDQNIGTGTVVAGNGNISGGAGLNTVQGIVQSVRTAGDLNSGLNDLSINITRNSGGTVPQTGAPLNGSFSRSNDAGAVSITPAGGGLQMAITPTNGQGFAQQQIGAGNITQQANITGSVNNVQNLAALNVALRDNPGLNNAANCAWEQLRALRKSGY
ncbi:hypothetical protein JQX08_14905 [Pseudomonas sp. UL073]|uniref:Fap system outer membrane protein n=1 Tax=Zestomonas insulae TaxID=2809017 RepID=A0ABS2IG00_9GAMM|nr:hypothetical protein [Pseudomonas insulae]MBM7061999.1 hypothetical protein [Pseudomonas insulae]